MTFKAYEAQALISAALETYRAEVLPALPADKRYLGAMIANALEIAGRDLAGGLAVAEGSLGAAAGSRPDDTMRDLAIGIRDGRTGLEEAKLRQLLLSHLERELAVRNPRFLFGRKGDASA